MGRTGSNREQETKTKMVVPVLWNREQILTAASSRTGKGIPTGEFRVAPGWNLIPADLWNKAVDGTMIARYLTEKIPPALAPEDSPEKVGSLYMIARDPVPEKGALAAMPREEAESFINECFQVPLLQRLLDDGETSEDHRIALRNQIERIENPKREAQRTRHRIAAQSGGAPA